MLQKTDVVVRSFQAGKNSETFNSQRFIEGVARPIGRILASEHVSSVIVVTCGEGVYAEMPTNGMLPTIVALEEYFKKEILAGRLIPHVCTSWGLNAGSATALNEGSRIALRHNAQFIMNWSPELSVTPDTIAQAFAHIERHSLDACGFLRSHWYMKLQWMVPQNTGAIWSARVVRNIGRFAEACNGDGQTTVETEGFGEAPLAGMEDFEAILRLFKAALQSRQPFPRLGMVCRAQPCFWDLSRKETGEYADKMKKIARQVSVMEAYAHHAFPDQPFEDTLATVMSHTYFD